MSDRVLQPARLNAGWLIGLTVFGVGIRLVFLLLTGDLEPHADESHYLYLALAWNRFGFYSDSALYLWPPGYPLFLVGFLRLFDAGGIFVAKLCQVLLSGIMGAVTILLAGHLFNWRAAWIAGLIWCFYLPLIGFTHTLWSETLYLAVFLPSFYLFITWWRRTLRRTGGDYHLVAAGLLAGLSLLIREAGLPWCGLLGVLILWRDLRWSIRTAASRALLFGLSVGVVVLPGTLRNYEVYGRFAPAGATLGQNVYWGLNGFYMNFDYPPRLLNDLPQVNPWVHRTLVAPVAPSWKQSTALNVIDRSGENVRAGLTYAWEHPAYVLRTRIKKVADWATPLSFFVRHYAWERYHGVLATPTVRRPLIVAALALPLLVLAGAIPGFWRDLRGSDARIVLGWTLVYWVPATALLNGMSRYRVGLEPLLIVLAAGFFSGAARTGWRRRTMAICVAGWLVLAGLWTVNAPEIAALVRSIW